jgi:acetyl esterase/lipase
MTPMMRKAMATLAAAFGLALAAGAAHAALLSPADVAKPPLPAADHRIAYGTDPSQVGDLWLPRGKGPHPAVVIVHGGCWQARLGGLEIMNRVSDDLRRRGYVVWNIEYRRLGQAGGGYPGTFADVGQGVDKLRNLARTYAVDLRHVVVLGHSAGGDLALWAAARGHLPKTSPLVTAKPLHLAAAVSLGGIADLAAYRDRGPAICGGPTTIDQIVGAAQRAGANVYADTSPAALVPLGARQLIVSGDVDPIVPKAFGHDYAAKARAAGDRVQVLDMPDAGHFELIDPRAGQWKTIVAAIEALQPVH